MGAHRMCLRTEVLTDVGLSASSPSLFGRGLKLKRVYPEKVILETNVQGNLDLHTTKKC